jgi:hypothetical protein
MGAAAWVTSRGGDTRKVRPGAAVRDASRNDRRDAAAESGGDAGRRRKVAVAGELAGRAGQHPPGGLGDPGAASGASRRGAALVDQSQADPGGLGLVFQGIDQVADPPQRHQRPPPPREPRPLITATSAFRGSEPGIGIAAQHRAGAHGVQLPERARLSAGEFPA